LAFAFAVDAQGMAKKPSASLALFDLLEQAVDLGVLTSREAAHVRGCAEVDEQGHCSVPDDMQRQMGKLFMMQVVPVNTWPL
jgi:hypothetical protein